MNSEKAYKYYDGTSDVRKFITKVELEAALKGYTDEKVSQYIASKLVGHAMDVYLRLSTEDRKDPEKLKAELLKEFERGQLNREEAITELDSRKRLDGESAETYAFKIMELVTLAYPTFAADAKASLAKDAFMRGLSKELQLAVKLSKDYKTMDLKATAEETVRAELAGVGKKKGSAEAIHSCDDMVDAIAEKVLLRLGSLQLTPDAENGSVNSVDNGQRQNRFRGRGRGRGLGRGRGRGSGGQSGSQRTCRACQSSDHFIKDCPTRFCQACGGRGHDQYSSNCPNYQA